MRRTRRAMIMVASTAALMGAQALQAHATGPNSMATGNIQEFPLPGQNASQHTPRDIVEGSDGNMWEVDSVWSSITRVTPTGQATTFAVTPQSSLMTGITAGPDGALWIVTYEGNIDRMTTGGVVTNSFPALPSGGQGDIVTGPDGNLWFTGIGAGGNIGRMTPQGVVTMFAVPNGSNTGALTVGPDGNIWFTDTVDFFTQAFIGRVNVMTGAVDEFAVPQNAKGHTIPSDITAGPDGNVWFSDVFDQIGKVTPAGVVTTYAVGNETPTPAQPSGIVAGPDGELWFTSQAFGVLGRMATDGTWSRFPLPSSIEAPQDIARGPHNTVWFSEDINRVGYIKLCSASGGCSL